MLITVLDDRTMVSVLMYLVQGWFLPFDNKLESPPLSWLLCAGGARIAPSTCLVQGSRCQPFYRLTFSHFASSGFRIASSFAWITYHHLGFPVRVVSYFFIYIQHLPLAVRQHEQDTFTDILRKLVCMCRTGHFSPHPQTASERS